MKTKVTLSCETHGTKQPNKEIDFDKAFSATDKEHRAIVSAECFSRITRSMNSVKVKTESQH